VHDRADGNVTQLHRIARLDRRISAGADLFARLHALRREDVTALAVGVLDQRDVAGAVRIVFNALDNAGDTVLVALEVDDPVLLTRATTDVTGRDAAGMVASTSLV